MTLVGPLESLVNELLQIERAGAGSWERVPENWHMRAILHDQVGLIALTQTMNWGTTWDNPGDAPEDPVGLSWAGVSGKSGKRWGDYKRGGLGAPHIDSSFLRLAYQAWGPPNLPRSILDSKSFDQIRQNEAWREEWRRWARPLVHLTNLRFHHWTAQTWIRKYWAPAVATNKTIQLAGVNARIRNSASGVGKRAAGASLEEQRRIYIAYKLKRSERAADRAAKQFKYALRVGAIVEHIKERMPWE